MIAAPVFCTVATCSLFLEYCRWLGREFAGDGCPGRMILAAIRHPMRPDPFRIRHTTPKTVTECTLMPGHDKKWGTVSWA